MARFARDLPGRLRGEEERRRLDRLLIVDRPGATALATSRGSRSARSRPPDRPATATSQSRRRSPRSTIRAIGRAGRPPGAAPGARSRSRRSGSPPATASRPERRAPGRSPARASGPARAGAAWRPDCRGAPPSSAAMTVAGNRTKVLERQTGGQRPLEERARRRPGDGASPARRGGLGQRQQGPSMGVLGARPPRAIAHRPTGSCGSARSRARTRLRGRPSTARRSARRPSSRGRRHGAGRRSAPGRRRRCSSRGPDRVGSPAACCMIPVPSLSSSRWLRVDREERSEVRHRPTRTRPGRPGRPGDHAGHPGRRAAGRRRRPRARSSGDCARTPAQPIASRRSGSPRSATKARASSAAEACSTSSPRPPASSSTA